MKRIIRWGLVSLVCCIALLVSVTTLAGHEVRAVEYSAEDWDTIKGNVGFKIMYLQLVRCHGRMQDRIDVTEDNAGAKFNSNTYFKDESLANDYLHFPELAGVGRKNQSSCPNFITGWKNNWLVNGLIFQNKYKGVLSLNKNATVPTSSFSPDSMISFLESVGYRKETKNDGNLDGRKCFYLKFKLNSAVYEGKSITGFISKPTNGEYFETLDYCVKESGGSISQTSDGIIALTGNNSMFGDGYDNGHLTDSSNMAIFNFANSGMAPGFRYWPNSIGASITWSGGVDYGSKMYLTANLITSHSGEPIMLRYPGMGSSMTLIPKTLNNKSEATNKDYCSSLGFTVCAHGRDGLFTEEIGSLMTPGTSINYATFKSSMVSFVDKMQDDNGLDLFYDVSAVDYSPQTTSYRKGGDFEPFVAHFLQNTSAFDYGAFNDAEKYVLYYTYLKNNYNTQTSEGDVSRTHKEKVTWLKDDGTFAELYIYNSDDTDAAKTQYMLNSSGMWDNSSTGDWDKIAKELAKIDVEKAFSDANITSVLDPTLEPVGGSTGDDDEQSTVSQCIESAGALGWIMCPVLDVVSDATMSLYGYIENNFLWIGSDVMGTGTGTHNAWKDFRNYANVAFIIMFLIVILSQITGFGISNYGIKKILPRLIAVALLANLSFIICQLAVDISDILGAGLKTGLAGLGGITEAGDAAYGVKNITLGVRNALFGTELLGGVAIAAVTWRIWLLPFLLAIIGALVGVFMFFLSLAVRQAGIIILVVLCPVAIVCYALPNTKKLFDKWFRLFTSLLMVYPICGLLMGGGQFASSLLVGMKSEDGDPKFMLTLTAMLLSVVPFFFIPTIVRTSLNAIGQLGARLSNFGRGISGRLTGGIRNSEGFRSRQRELAAQRDERTVRNLDRWSKVRGALGLNPYSKSGQRRRSLAYARADKVRREDLLGQSYNGRELLSEDEARQKQLLGNLATKDFEERVSGAKATFRDDPSMATEGNIIAKHNELLKQFGNDPSNIKLQSQLRALEEMAMEKGAPGQDMLQQSFARYMAKNKNSWNSSKEQAISKLSAGLATRYGKELNGSDKGFNTMVNQFADGNFSKLESFSGSDDTGYRSAYDAKLAGFTASGMSKATPGALERGYDAMRSGMMSADDALTLTSNATQAVNDEIISKDIKPPEMSTVQNIVGYGAAAVITNLEQGTIDSISRFVSGTNDTEALSQLGANIQYAADNGHAYSEAETKQIGRLLGQINAKAGTSYKFNPASVQVKQGGQQSSILTGGSPEELARLKSEADKKILGR